MSAVLHIVTYDARYKDAFARLNYAWIERYFAVEAVDRQILDDPEGQIIATGGQIFFALSGDRAIGTVALKKEAAGRFELTKMAVEETMRGQGCGKLLLQAAIDYARKLAATQVVLSSNTVLTPAITMYRTAGFTERQQAQSCYTRCNIYMELDLNQPPRR